MAAFRTYIQKGGFVIVDDFKVRGWGGGMGGGGWENFAEQMNRVLPGVRFFEMDPAHAIFRGVFEDNDPENYVVFGLTH